MRQNDEQVLVILIGVAVAALLLARRRWRPSTTAFGTARVGVRDRCSGPRGCWATSGSSSPARRAAS